MADISLQNVDENGLNPTYSNADSGSGDKIKNVDGDVILHFKNESATDSATVTVTAQKTSTSMDGFGDLTKANVALTLGAGESRFVGPFPKKAFNDSDQKVNVAYSGTAAADVDVAALQIEGVKGVE